MYVKANNQTVEQFPYTLGDLRRDNPNVSFPKYPSESLLAEWGVYVVVSDDLPASGSGQVVEQASEPVYENGEWVLKYIVRNMTQEELDHQGELIRGDRNRLLADCDWTQIEDAPLTLEQKAEWSGYRQELRDISEQSGFPYDINWPIAP